jgi:hypothetical protein
VSLLLLLYYLFIYLFKKCCPCIRSSVLRNRVNEIVISLAVADTLYVCNIPLHVVDVYFVTIEVTNRTVCLLIFACDYTVMILSNLNVVLMTIDRYVAVVHPFIYVKYGNSLPVVRWLIGAMWVYSLGVGASFFIYNKWTPESYCIPELTEQPILAQTLVLPEVGVGAVLIIVLYGRIFFIAAKQSHKITDTSIDLQASAFR